MKQTKIVASISDRRCDQDFIRKLFFAGMNVVRMNTAHATEEGIRTIVKNVPSAHIGIMIDTKGPEVRTTGVKEPIHYNVGDVVKIFGRPEMESAVMGNSGKTPRIAVIAVTTACKARRADSRPAPGPFTHTSRVFIPCSAAFFPASSAATCAAYGVDLRDPLKP